MNGGPTTEVINCPFCSGPESEYWTKENGFTAVKCSDCGLVYVNPRPIATLIDEAVKTGVHSDVDHGRTAIVRRAASNVRVYEKIFSSMYSDVWERTTPISWLDIGAGYGEVIEAVANLAPQGSTIEGLEPMEPKRNAARKRGLAMREGYLSDVKSRYDFVSLVNVYSHIPNFHEFLKDLKKVLSVGGEFFVETGNIGDLDAREVPSELDLPDHLVFAGEKNIEDYLTNAGFEIIEFRRRRKDGVINFAKNIGKKMIGRQVNLTLPYTSRYRSIMIRAALT
ncbi:MAG: methyltransferase domain-containing protein [Gammaproteobacteria bacterium]|nr:methyltransferase domain-containing protein [Gammaproteobacteria bacterium]